MLGESEGWIWVRILHCQVLEGFLVFFTSKGVANMVSLLAQKGFNAQPLVLAHSTSHSSGNSL